MDAKQPLSQSQEFLISSLKFEVNPLSLINPLLDSVIGTHLLANDQFLWFNSFSSLKCFWFETEFTIPFGDEESSGKTFILRSFFKPLKLLKNTPTIQLGKKKKIAGKRSKIPMTGSTFLSTKGSLKHNLIRFLQVRSFSQEFSTCMFFFELFFLIHHRAFYDWLRFFLMCPRVFTKFPGNALPFFFAPIKKK